MWFGDRGGVLSCDSPAFGRTWRATSCLKSSGGFRGFHVKQRLVQVSLVRYQAVDTVTQVEGTLLWAETLGRVG